jgi:hypothetical protein
MTARVQFKKKKKTSLVLSLKGLGDKTNYLVVNRQFSNFDFDFDCLERLVFCLAIYIIGIKIFDEPNQVY